MSHRCAIVGAGPAGIYAAEILAEEHGIEVDIFEALPVPCGLVRYGVAPDHFSIRSVRDKLVQTLDHPKVRFFGNVTIGRDVSVSDLSEWYDAVIYTYGASQDRRLSIPGEDHPMSIPATEFVRWYTGHPDAGDFSQHLASATNVVVIGLGNVAVDVTRILVKPIAELETTDMPEHVLEALRQSSVRHVHVVGRRGPQHGTFTTKELKELGELSGVGVSVHAEDLPANDQEASNGNRVIERNLAVLREWSTRESDTDSPGSIEFHFWSKPEEIDIAAQVIRVERMEIGPTGDLQGTGNLVEIPADLVIRSVGYRGESLEGLIFDSAQGVIPHSEGKVDQSSDAYVAGWIKRGPSGIIGTNKKDASATVLTLVASLDGVSSRSIPSEKVIEELAHRNISFVDVEGWKRIDTAERSLGASQGRERTTIHERQQLLAIAGGTTQST